jgi:LysM repeat protein
VIKIPPVSGVIYQIKKGDTIEEIAQRYKLDKKEILKQNLLSVNDNIRI